MENDCVGLSVGQRIEQRTRFSILPDNDISTAGCPVLPVANKNSQQLEKFVQCDANDGDRITSLDAGAAAARFSSHSDISISMMWLKYWWGRFWVMHIIDRPNADLQAVLG